MQNNENQAIWNPSRVAGLSFVFSPAFGSYLQASNWRSLGHPEKVASSKAWFYISLIFMAVLGGLSVYLEGGKAGSEGRGIVNLAYIVYYLIWGFGSGAQQAKYVQKQFGKHYAKKSLLKPILCALGLCIVYAAAIVGLLIATHGSDDDEGSNTDQASASSDQASTSSGGSSFSLGRGDHEGLCPPRLDACRE
jgi:hypothetical protein